MWEELRTLLSVNPGLQANTLFAYLQRRYPGKRIEIGTGLYDDLLGNLRDLKGQKLDGVVLRPDGLHYEGPSARIVDRWIMDQVRSK